MKKLFLMFGLVFTTTLAQADEVCQEISQLAGLVMAARQEGLSQTEMQQVSDNALQGYEPDYRTLFTAMINDAYKVPRYLTDTDKNKTIKNFTLDYYQVCLNLSSQ